MGVKVREKEKGSGVYWVFISHNGSRKSKMIGDEDLAEQVAKKIRAKIELGIYEPKKTIKKKKYPAFKDYAEVWLNDYIKSLRRPSTFERYQDNLVRYIYPAIGSKSIGNLKRGDIRNLLLKLHKKGLSRASIALVKDVISGPMEYAIDEEIITGNPTRGILKRLNIERDKRISVEPMTNEEVKLFLETCLKYETGYFPFFLTAFRTGMRLGELIALKWTDVDWNGKFIKVQRSFRRGVVSHTKTGKERRVDMSDQLISTLKALQTKRKREALKIGKGDPVDWIFNRGDKPISQNSIRNVFKRILKKAGLRHMRVHDMRHSFASLLLSNGESPVYVKEQLGHSSIQMTVDIYGHLIPSSNRKAVNRLDDPAPNLHPICTLENKKAVTI